MAATLELPQDALCGHFPLEVLDGALDAFVANLDFERLTLDGIGGVRQGTALLTCLLPWGNPLSPLQAAPPSPKDPTEVTANDRDRPTNVRAPHGARGLEMTWGDGKKISYPHEILRGFCPCASCQGHSGAIRFQADQNLELRELEQVGNYALGLTWADGHSSGIYSFRYLRALGELLEAQGAEGLKALGELPRV